MTNTKATVAEAVNDDKKLEEHELSEIASSRHNMHCYRIDSNNPLSKYLELAEAVENIIKLNLDLMDSLDVSELCCDNDECEGDCIECKNIEQEYLDDNKERVNNIIENFMNDHDEQHDTESAPSGMARLRWMESV